MEKETRKELEEKLKSFMSFSINRIPTSTFEKFKELADKEFCSDYGMTLKWLLDNFDKDWKYKMLKEEIDKLKKSIEKVKKNG